MKKILIIFAFAATVMAVQSCGNKKAEEERLAAVAKAKEDSIQAAKVAREERSARIKRERDEYSERRRIAAEERAKANQTYTDSKGKLVYNKVDVPPMFRSGEEDLENYIQDNINYPNSAQTDQIEGTVFVDFVVGADGAVRDVEVGDTTSEDVKQKLSEEAVRVVSTMPTWTAGTQNGKRVDVRVSLPITFQLEM